MFHILADLPAQASLLNMQHHKSISPCCFCYIKGQKTNNSIATVFLSTDFERIRTPDSFKKDVDQALIQNHPINGVKGILFFLNK